MKMQAFFDVETTGLIENESRPLAQQPRIIELGLVVCDASGEVMDEFGTFINPEQPITEEITRITGITNAELVGAPTFVEALGELTEQFLGLREVSAHNSRFDQMMLVFELRRLGKEFEFPYPLRWQDTKALYPGKLADWAREVKGEHWIQTHRALDDARLLRDCWAAMKYGR